MFRLAEITREVLASRRVTFIALQLVLLALGLALLLETYAADGLSLLEWAILPIFLLLFSQIANGFALSLLGFVQILLGGDRYRIMRTLPPAGSPLPPPPMAPTAIVLPVYNEDIHRVLQAVENMWHSLHATGRAEHFDFFILSDSNRPETWLREECAWLSLCRRLNAFGRICYRKRRVSLNAKSGNIADFCRRWGKRYRYMLTLDADSVMTGDLMARLVQAMEANPQVGLIQTPPVIVLGKSLLRRLFQFTARLCGPVFSAGVNFWQLSGGNFWGHNAIIRLAPFMQYCDLPELPEPERSKRHILSHDTVEAALMRRAGYEVWFACDEEGSWEEGPPNLLDMLKRDRRWCQGNLQHFWFLAARKINFANRLHIWFGLMSYLSSPLWLLFLILSAVDAAQKQRFALLSALPSASALGLPIPLNAMQLLLLVTAALLFLPKLLGWLSALPHARRFGGILPMTASVLLETALSVLLAPILMIFYSQFVLLTLLGLKVKWVTQNRAGTDLPLSECFRTFGPLTLLGAATGLLTWFYMPYFFWWLTPIFGGWLLSIPIAQLTSKESWGLALRRAGLLLIPEEVEHPPELRHLEDDITPPAEDTSWFTPHPDAGPFTGLAEAVANPYVNAVHIALLRQRPNRAPHTRQLQAQLRQKLLDQGPSALTHKEKMLLLWDADSLDWLHRRLWATPPETLHPSWLPHLAPPPA